MNVDRTPKAMPTEDAAPSRRIVLDGLAAGGPAPETAINLLDDAGNTLHRVPINEDGSCELPEEALESARGILFGPINVGLSAGYFRELLDTKDNVDAAALLAGPEHAAPQSAPATDAGENKMERMKIHPHPC